MATKLKALAINDNPLVSRTIFLSENQVMDTKETATPVHLCQAIASALYPSSCDKNKPMTAEIAAVNAAESKTQSPISLLITPSVFSLFLLKKPSQTAAIINKTMGKCSSNECILPTTCSHVGIANALPKRMRKTSRQLRAKVML